MSIHSHCTAATATLSNAYTARILTLARLSEHKAATSDGGGDLSQRQARLGSDLYGEGA